MKIKLDTKKHVVCTNCFKLYRDKPKYSICIECQSEGATRDTTKLTVFLRETSLNEMKNIRLRFEKNKFRYLKPFAKTVSLRIERLDRLKEQFDNTNETTLKEPWIKHLTYRNRSVTGNFILESVISVLLFPLVMIGIAVIMLTDKRQ